MFWKLSTKRMCIVYNNNNLPGRAFRCCYCCCLSSSVVAQRGLCDDQSARQLVQNRERLTSEIPALWEAGGLCITNLIIGSEIFPIDSLRSKAGFFSLKEKLCSLFLRCLSALPDLISITRNMDTSCLKFPGWGVTQSWNKHYFTWVLFSLIYAASEQITEGERRKGWWKDCRG